jgi:AraC-like DNA-binding protein
MNTTKQVPSNDELFFEVRSIESLSSNDAWPEKDGMRDPIQIVWFSKGAGHYCIDMERYPLAANTLFVVPAGCMQQLRASQEISGWVLSFDPDFLHLPAARAWTHFYKEMIARFPRVIMLRLKDAGTEGILMNVLREMIRECREPQRLQGEALSGLLHIFLIYVQRLATPVPFQPTSNKKVDLFNSFYSRLEKNFLTKRSVAEYASELSVTPNYLSDVVKRVSGHSANHHIQQRMVLEAKRLAMYSEENMKLIAYKLGFDDLSHFSKFFKNAAGINFSDFRNRGRVGLP